MIELRDIIWMQFQWKRFRRVLAGATGVVWLMCSGGIILLGVDEELEWFHARMAMLLMLVSSTAVSVWLFIAAWREMRRLKALAEEVRQQELAEPQRDSGKRKGGRQAAPGASA